MSLEPDRLSAAKLLERMFDVEFRFLGSRAGDAALLAAAFAARGHQVLTSVP